MVTAVTVTAIKTHKLILCKLYSFYAKVIYFWSVTYILMCYVVHNSKDVVVSSADFALPDKESIKQLISDVIEKLRT